MRKEAQFSRNPYNSFSTVFWADFGHENRGKGLLFGGTDFEEIRTATVQQLQQVFEAGGIEIKEAMLYLPYNPYSSTIVQQGTKIEKGNQRLML